MKKNVRGIKYFVIFVSDTCTLVFSDIFNESVFILSLIENLTVFKSKRINIDYTLTLYSDIRCTQHLSRYGCGV